MGLEIKPSVPKINLLNLGTNFAPFAHFGSVHFKLYFDPLTFGIYEMLFYKYCSLAR